MNDLKFKTKETATTTSPFLSHASRAFNRSQDDVNCEDVKRRGLG